MNDHHDRAEYSAPRMLPLRFWILVAMLGLSAASGLFRTPEDVDIPDEMEQFYEARLRECRAETGRSFGKGDTVPKGTLTSALECAGAPRGCGNAELRR